MQQDKKTIAQAEALVCSRGGFTSKLHGCCDTLENPGCFILTPGQYSDHGQAKNLLGDDEPGAVVGDKGYDSGRNYPKWFFFTFDTAGEEEKH